MQTSRDIYSKLLCEAHSEYIFYRSMSFILAQDPYFIPAHLEHIWEAEKRNDQFFANRLCQEAHTRIKQICVDVNVRSKVLANWSTLEQEAALELLDMISRRQYGLTRLATIVQKKLIRDLDISKRTNTISGRFLRLEHECDAQPLKEELASAGLHWWNFNTTRATNNPNHQHTHLIALRQVPEPKAEYTPVDGVHESLPSPEHKRFPKIYDTVMEFAARKRLGLARVAIVKMQPFHQSYRHYDSEFYLVGRNRYHLVVDSGSINILSSGTDTIQAKPGDIWLFDNKVMHRADNKSRKSRTHVIFDGYPL